MAKMVALIRRELGVYFVSPIAYVILTGVLLVTGVMFYGNLKLLNEVRVPFTFDFTLYILVWLVLLISPWVTARLIAEEKNRGTIETLMTAPVTEFQVVLSKYVAAMAFLIYLIAPTLFFVVLISGHADVDWGAVLTGYFGVIMAASWIVAIGLFISSLCNSQMTAGILTLLVAIGLLLIKFGSMFITENWLREILLAVNMVDYTSDFLRGVVDTRQVALAVSLVFFFLYGSVVAMGSRRWR